MITWINLLALLGGLIVLVLALIAGHLLYKVYRLKQRQARRLAEQEQANLSAQQAQRERLNKSIQIIAQAVQQQELSLTEASLRISVLLDNLDVGREVKDEFSAFYQLRGLTEHIPILDAWQQLSRKAQNDFDIERLNHEATYNDFVLDATKRIIGRHF